MWNICLADVKMRVGIRQEGILLADGDHCVWLCRPHQELDINFEGHRGLLQDF